VREATIDKEEYITCFHHRLNDQIHVFLNIPNTGRVAHMGVVAALHTHS
jgi:hypothetical protein